MVGDYLNINTISNPFKNDYPKDDVSLVFYIRKKQQIVDDDDDDNGLILTFPVTFLMTVIC